LRYAVENKFRPAVEEMVGGGKMPSRSQLVRVLNEMARASQTTDAVTRSPTGQDLT
jgi:hypothetical protein